MSRRNRAGQDQAELTRWHPGFAGKRTWATVRRHLLQATEHKIARGDALRARLYVPEPFSIDERDAINARRLAQWRQGVAAPGKPQRLMLLIGEVKEIVPARYGFKAIVKHMPDQAFAIDEQLYGKMGRRFGPELELWGTADDIHMIMVATFGVSSAGIPALQELCLMPVNRQWIPAEDGFDKLLVDQLISEGRCFVKAMHYNVGQREDIACALLTDTAVPVELHVVDHGDECSATAAAKEDAASSAPRRWTWHPRQQALPAFPVKRGPRPPVHDAN